MGETRAVKLRYTRPALGDLESILDYIQARSPGGATTVSRRLRAAIDLLAERPYLGTRTDDPTFRRLATPPYPYLVFYEVAESEIIIHAIRHAAREPSSMPGGKAR